MACCKTSFKNAIEAGDVDGQVAAQEQIAKLT